VKVVTVACEKGGVGKTTTAFNLGVGFALDGLRVLLADLDVQGDLGKLVGVVPEEDVMAPVLKGQKPLGEVVRRVAEGEGDGCVFWLAPAGTGMRACEAELGESPDGLYSVRDALASVADDFDVVVLDSPPSLRVHTGAALVAADAVVVPLQLEPLPFDGAKRTLDHLERLRKRFNPTLASKHVGVLPTMVRPGVGTHSGFRDAVVEEWGERYSVLDDISHTIRLPEMGLAFKSIYHYAPGSPVAAQYRATQKEVGKWLASSAQK